MVATYTPFLILGGMVVVLFIILALRAPKEVVMARIGLKEKSSKDFTSIIGMLTQPGKLLPFVVGGVILLWIFNYILSSILGSFGVKMATFKIGIPLMVLLIAAAIFLIWKMLYADPTQIFFDDYRNWVTIGIIVAMIIALLVFLPWMVPDLFSVAVADTRIVAMSMMSAIGA